MYQLNATISEFEKPESLASFIKRLGNPESTPLLHSSCSIFHIPEIDGVIGYHQIGNCAVVIGDPICMPEDTAKLTDAFHLHCQAYNLRTLYLLASYNFAHWAIENGCRTLIQVGSQLSINPTNFKTKRKLRWQLNQSVRHGVHVKEYTTFDPALEQQMQSTVHTWLKQREGPQMHLGDITLFDDHVEKRIFYAEQNNKIIGLLILNPLDRLQGWVVSNCLALPGAPVGTTERLMCTTFDSLAQENCPFLCLGIVSGTQVKEVIGLSPFGKKLAGLIFKTAKWFFKLDAKQMYFSKYQPHFNPTFLLCRGQLTISELIAIKQVLKVQL